MTRMEMGGVNIGCHDKDGDGKSEHRVSRLRRSEHIGCHDKDGDGRSEYRVSRLRSEHRLP